MNQYTVYANKTELQIRTASVNPAPYHRVQRMEYVQFMLREPVVLHIKSETLVTEAVIRPLSLGMKAELKNGEIQIRIERPVKFSLEINGQMLGNLLVLAEEDRYAAFDPYGAHVRYFPAGVQEADIITVKEDHTIVYLEEGAYIHGKINLDHCSDVMVCGYGAISMERYPYEMRPTHNRTVDIRFCTRVTVRDITILDTNDWSLRVLGSEDVHIDNVKIIGFRGNSDGVDVCGSRRVLVENVFTRVWDDSLVVKGLDTGDAEDITFRNCILWNDFARPMEIGVELRTDHVRRICYENIDILHSPTGYPLMGIHHGDRALVSDIVFENIRIEDAPSAQLFDLRITPSYWNRDNRMGAIRDIVFRNIRLYGTGLPCLLSDSRIQGYSEEHEIRNVRFESINICGKTPGSPEALGLICRDFAKEISVIPAPNLEELRPVKTRIWMETPFARRTDGWYEGTAAVQFENQEPFSRTKEVWLQVSPAVSGRCDREKKSVTIPANGTAVLRWSLVIQPGTWCIALQSDDPEIRYAFLYERLDWIIGSEFAAQPLEFTDCRNNRFGTMQARVRENGLELKSPLFVRKDVSITLYAAVPVERQPGEVVFSAEETDFGGAPALIWSAHGIEAAPQLRCPLEITLVFKNEPKVKEIRAVTIRKAKAEDTETKPAGVKSAETAEIKTEESETVRIPFEDLGLPDKTTHFWLEIAADLPETRQYRYPYTLFHSVTPKTTAHMFGNCRVIEPFSNTL